MRRLLTLVMVLMLALGASAPALGQDDGPSPDSPTKDRDADDAGQDDGDEQDDGGADEEDPADDEPLPEAPDGPLDLAAMALDSDDMPDGFSLVAEAYVDLDDLADNLSDVVTESELDDLGIVGYYETTYVAADSQSQIRSYVIEYPDPAAAEDGFALFEDEDRMVTSDNDLEDEPGLEGVGEEPAEITTGGSGVPGAEQATVDVTYRIDRLGVGVAMETFDGSDPDRDLVEELAGAKEARVVAALTGDDIEDVDPELPARVIGLDGVVTFEGYQTVVDGYGSLDLPAAEGFVSSYVRGATFSDDPTLTITPYVTVSVSRYEDGAAASAALEASDAFMPQFPGLEAVEVPPIDGSPAAAYAFESLVAGGDLASVRVFVAVDDALLSVDVQGFATTDEALDVATDIAEAAAGCVDGGDCGSIGLPDDELGPAGDDAPVASPEADEDDAP